MRYRYAGQLVLIIAGAWWCIEAIKRAPDDWALLKKPIAVEQRWAILLSWGLTVVIAAATLYGGTHLAIDYVAMFQSVIRE